MRFDHDELVSKLCRRLPRLSRRATPRLSCPLKHSAFTLAWLYAVGEGERRHFRDFWRHIQLGKSTATQPVWEQAYLRRLRAFGSLHAVSRSVGYPQTPEAMQKLTSK